jgi:hypothetical protein
VTAADEGVARLTAAELVARHRGLPQVNRARLRAEADELFGTEDRIPVDDAEDEGRGRGLSG